MLSGIQLHLLPHRQYSRRETSFVDWRQSGLHRLCRRRNFGCHPNRVMTLSSRSPDPGCLRNLPLGVSAVYVVLISVSRG